MPLVSNKDATCWCPSCVYDRGAETFQQLPFITYHLVKNKFVCIIILCIILMTYSISSMLSFLFLLKFCCAHNRCVMLDVGNFSITLTYFD